MADSMIRGNTLEMAKGQKRGEKRAANIRRLLTINGFDPECLDIDIPSESKFKKFHKMLSAFHNSMHETMFGGKASTLILGKDAWVIAGKIAAQLNPYYYTTYAISAVDLIKAVDSREKYNYNKEDYCLENEVIDTCEWADFLFIYGLEDLLEKADWTFGNINTFLKGRKQAGLCTFISTVLDQETMTSALSRRGISGESFTVFIEDNFNRALLPDLVEKEDVWE